MGHRCPQRPPSNQDTAAFLPPCTYADARGCYLQAARGRTPEGELAKSLATTALHAQGTGLSPPLGRPRSESAQVLNSGRAACQAGREDDLGAGRPQATPPEAGSGLAPPLPACSMVTATASCAAPTLHTSLRLPVRFRPHGAHAHSHECFDSSGRGEGAGVARVGSAPPSEGCHYGEPGKRGRAGAPPGPRITRKQVSGRVGLAGYLVSTVRTRNPAAHAHAQQRLRSSLGLAPG